MSMATDIPNEYRNTISIAVAQPDHDQSPQQEP